MKLSYQRDELIAVKALVGSRPSSLAADCPVLATRVAVAVPVVRHVKKASPQSQRGRVSEKDREMLADLKKSIIDRTAIQVEAPRSEPTRPAPEKEKTKAWNNKPAVPKTSAETPATTTKSEKSAESQQQKSAEVQKAAPSEKPSEPRGWSTVTPSNSAGTDVFPTKALSRNEKKRIADGPKKAQTSTPLPTAAEPKAKLLPGDPAAHLPVSDAGAPWTCVAVVSPQLKVVPVPVVVDENGKPLLAEKEELKANEQEFDCRGRLRPKTLNSAELNRRLWQRERQIRLGMRTLGYKVWERFRLMGLQGPVEAGVPPPTQSCSKRSWDGQVRRWRQLLHEYDDLAPRVFNEEELELLHFYDRKNRDEEEREEQLAAAEK